MKVRNGTYVDYHVIRKQSGTFITLKKKHHGFSKCSVFITPYTYLMKQFYILCIIVFKGITKNGRSFGRKKFFTQNVYR
jgi:hypothetical protein